MIERAIRESEEENTHSIMDEMLEVTPTSIRMRKLNKKKASKK